MTEVECLAWRSRVGAYRSATATYTREPVLLKIQHIGELVLKVPDSRVLLKETCPRLASGEPIIEL